MDAREARDLNESIERGRKLIETGHELIELFKALPPLPTAGVNNTASASVVTGTGWAVMIAIICAAMTVGMFWSSVRDRDSAERVRVAQAEAITAQWRADVAIRDARAETASAERTAELRILAAERRADLAELASLRAELVHTKGQAGLARTINETLAQRFAKLEAKLEARQ